MLQEEDLSSAVLFSNTPPTCLPSQQGRSLGLLCSVEVGGSDRPLAERGSRECSGSCGCLR
jgi:hypothetical protein